MIPGLLPLVWSIVIMKVYEAFSMSFAFSDPHIRIREGQQHFQYRRALQQKQHLRGMGATLQMYIECTWFHKKGDVPTLLR